MEWSRRQARIIAAALIGVVAVFAFARLASFGIWDPWELSTADLARQVATGEAGGLDQPPLAVWLIARGFSLFGIHEWSGRLPMAFAGMIAVLLAYVLAARFAGRRAAVWTAVITGTTPLLLLNARQMLGAAPAMAASAGVFLCAMSFVFLPARIGASAERRRLLRGAWLLGLAASIALATLASGVLLGVAPPLLAVAVAVLARRELQAPFADRDRAIAAGLMLLFGLGVAIGAAHAVWADYAGYGVWTGGVARGGDPPTWEMVIERVFHSFAPWSALLPLALARMVGAPSGRDEPPEARPMAPQQPSPVVSFAEENALRLAVVGWVAFGFLAQTLYTARFGPATFLPVAGAAAAVALLVRDVERSDRAWWGISVVSFLFVGLIVRDYGEYPGSPIGGLAADGIEVPEVFRPKMWAVVLGLFGLSLALGLAADPSSPFEGLRRDLRAIRESALRGGAAKATVGITVFRLGVPTDLIGEQWRRGYGFRVWLILIALLVSSMLGFGLACAVAPEALTAGLGMTTLSIRVGRVLLLVPPAIVVLVVLARFALFLFAKLGSYRLVPAMIAGLAVAGYTSLVFQPELSSHFSPREVYDNYNARARPGEPLGEFRVGGRAAAYYATGEVQELETQAQLLEFLRTDTRVWAAFRADDLAAIDREYRRQAGRHLFVVDASSARMLLASNQPVEGLENQNYLAGAILDEAPSPQHPLDTSFDDRIILIGYDLELPHGTYVGPGEAFTITWYFRVDAPVSGSYKPFVHIDGPGMRINGDHDPVDGHYPVRLWEPGDIIVDRQELRVPANYRQGSLTIYMGFYAGEQRLEVRRGPADDVNRATVGTLTVR